MLERILKGLVAVGLLVLYWQHLLAPNLADLDLERQTLLQLEARLRYCGGDWDLTRKRLMTERQMVAAGAARNRALLPPFSAAREHLQAKFDAAKSAVPGHWDVAPGATFVDDGSLARWPFHVRFVGSFIENLRALAFLEASGQLVRILAVHVAPDPKGIALECDVELLFQSAETGARP